MKFISITYLEKNKGRGIITLTGSYHGRTLGAEMAGGKKNYDICCCQQMIMILVKYEY